MDPVIVKPEAVLPPAEEHRDPPRPAWYRERRAGQFFSLKLLLCKEGTNMGEAQKLIGRICGLEDGTIAQLRSGYYHLKDANVQKLTIALNKAKAKPTFSKEKQQFFDSLDLSVFLKVEGPKPPKTMKSTRANETSAVSILPPEEAVALPPLPNNVVPFLISTGNSSITIPVREGETLSIQRHRGQIFSFLVTPPRPKLIQD